jgi:hypothetical protein
LPLLGFAIPRDVKTRFELFRDYFTASLAYYASNNPISPIPTATPMEQQIPLQVQGNHCFMH